MAMSCLIVAIAWRMSCAPICRSISGMSMCAGQAKKHGAKQSPTWSLNNNSSAVRRSVWTSSVSLSYSVPSTTLVAQAGAN